MAAEAGVCVRGRAGGRELQSCSTRAPGRGPLSSGLLCPGHARPLSAGGLGRGRCPESVRPRPAAWHGREGSSTQTLKTG